MGGGIDQAAVVRRIKATDAARAQIFGFAFAITFAGAAAVDFISMGTLRQHGFMLGQLLITLFVVVFVRFSALGKRHAGHVFGACMSLVSATGAAHLAQFGGLDGPWFYGSYTAPPVLIPMLLRLRARVLWTVTSVSAFVLVYQAVRPAVFDHEMAHIPLVYLATIGAIAIALGHHVMQIEVGGFIDVARLEGAAIALKTQLLAGDEKPGQLRAEIARQLHDDVAQLITGARIHLDGWTRRSANDDAGKRLAELLDELAHRARRMLEELREPPARGALVDELEHLRSDYFGLGLEVSVVIEDNVDVIALTPLQTEGIVTAVREALTNAIRHAAASEATVSVHIDDDVITLDIFDNGTGSADDLQEGYGLLGIRERVAGLGGEVVLSNYEEGLRLTVTLPLRQRLAP